jgi:hypothetical protein
MRGSVWEAAVTWSLESLRLPHDYQPDWNLYNLALDNARCQLKTLSMVTTSSVWRKSFTHILKV